MDIEETPAQIPHGFLILQRLEQRFIHILNEEHGGLALEGKVANAYQGHVQTVPGLHHPPRVRVARQHVTRLGVGDESRGVERLPVAIECLCQPPGQLVYLEGGRQLTQATNERKHVDVHKAFNIQGLNCGLQGAPPTDPYSQALVQRALQVPRRRQPNAPPQLFSAQAFPDRDHRLAQSKGFHKLSFHVATGIEGVRDSDVDDPLLARLGQQPRNGGARNPQFIGNPLLCQAILVVEVGNPQQHL